MRKETEVLGVGLLGSGFINEFHLKAFRYVREAEITAICSRTSEGASRLAEQARAWGLGEPRVYTDLRAFLQDPQVEAVWVGVPNYLRLEVAEAIADEVRSGRASLRGVAWEKPMARNLKEARTIYQALTEAGVLHGYLENQIYAPSLVRGKELTWKRGAALAGPPYLARAAEEHSGPHRPWFWRGDLQGGGVLSDMMCHSVAAGWFLLTPLGDPMTRLRPETVSAQIAGLKWVRPSYAEELFQATGGQVDYRQAPAEDYAAARVVFRAPSGEKMLVEASTSWSFVGPGLRLTFELLGPEYSLFVNTLEGEAKIFFSRRVQGEAGEDLVEKQNAEQGLMPFLAEEAFTYGYISEDQHMVQAFLKGVRPLTTLEEGLAITELLMAAYLSAEEGCTVALPEANLEDFVPAVQKGTWKP
ncbi:Gfo/Idh/MocA family protein [Thermus thermophilus]|uniref:Gfo/Idh/MocA family protein n=1 Tax=Thermus thermophilus TaxID=274 RepID=UPI001FCC7272|nr:Gfo/Idh/MocA family oxidoreductase [Thermus thermophilus]BDG29990.1 dehydrogenase [Thermus thermophilus]